MIPNSWWKFGNLYLVLFATLTTTHVHSLSDLETGPTTTTDAVPRCPAASNSTVLLVADKSLCNVYHECFYDESQKSELVKSQVCPPSTVFTASSRKCEAIEKHGCTSSYLHWIDPSYTPQGFIAKSIGAELTNTTGMSTFRCPSYATNERFPDPDICNLFHVCVRRDNVTYDQPFLCPFSSVFRVNDSKTMYCDVSRDIATDCNGKAFYRSVDAEDVNEFIKLNSLIIETSNASSSCPSGLRREDQTYCNTFHVCTSGKEEHFMCEKNLMFNPVSRICDYPINVACYEKKIFREDQLYNQDSKAEKIIKSKMQSLILYPGDATVTEELSVFGVRIKLKCPIGAKNYIYPDREFCNVFHHCHGFSGKVSICDKGMAFDPLANGQDEPGVCNFEELVDCTGKFLLEETGKRAGKGIETQMGPKFKFQPTLAGDVAGDNEPENEELISGIVFDCAGKANGHYRDKMYCDVFHACISNERKKTYSCAHMGARNYFDEVTKKCEFLNKNPSICMHSIFYKPVVKPVAPKHNFLQTTGDEYNEKWKHFIRSRETFTCVGRLDGFYASRWCNVFYRCFMGIRSEFLCPKMMNKGRLWWVQHDSSQEVPQTSAACVWPCETKSKCMSPGGTVIEKLDGSYAESIEESNRVWEQSNCDGTEKPGRQENKYGIMEHDFSCHGRVDGDFFPSKHCNIFHRCTNGKRTDFQCPKATNTPYDLWWNDELGQCDWPCKLNCTSSVYGTQKTAKQVQAQDFYYNEQECTAHLKLKKTTPMPAVSQITTKLIKAPYPDEDFVCGESGLVMSPSYCNVYYSCKGYSTQPQFAFYCVDGHFDPHTKTCKTKREHACPYYPALIYPLIAIEDVHSPEEAKCASSHGPYLKGSQRYGNVFYECDGHSQTPKVFRCYNRELMEDAYYSKELKQCISKSLTKFRPVAYDMLRVKEKYLSTPVDHTRFSDLKPLSCRADQQYLAEHDKFCNLYHSCILGKYQMYACISIGSFDRTSYFYYTNGNCGAASQSKCGFGKSVYSYGKLFPNKLGKLVSLDNTPYISSSERFISSKVASSVSTVSLHEQFGPIILIKNQDSAPSCTKEDFIIPDKKFCNLFYECKGSKLSSFICIDNTTGMLNGIYDLTDSTCKPFNASDCLTNSFFNPESKDIENSVKPLEEALLPPIDMAQFANEQIPSTNEAQKQQKVVFRTNSNFTCLGRKNGYYESEWCNVYFQCESGRRIDTRCSPSLSNSPDYDLWWVYQNAVFDPLNPMKMQGSDGEARCEWPCKTKCQKKIWTPEFEKATDNTVTYESILKIETELRPKCFKDSKPMKEFNLNETATITTLAGASSELKSADPSGFDCQGRIGVFKDPLFCNIYHECKASMGKRSFVCKQQKSASSSKGVANVYDMEAKTCVESVSGFQQCYGMIYEEEFLFVPAIKKLPQQQDGNKCSQAGVFRAVGAEDKSFCDLFYWCNEQASSPIYFYCDVDFLTKDAAVFNLATKRCEMRKNSFCEANQSIYSDTLTLKASYFDQAKEIMNDKSRQTSNSLSTETNLFSDPAPGYLSINPSQFSTSFACASNTTGYFADTNYCDIFHFCYASGEFKTYACPIFTNDYHTWFSYKNKGPFKHAEINCDFSCRFKENVSECSADKKILIKTKNITGGVSRDEVFSDVCSKLKN